LLKAAFRTSPDFITPKIVTLWQQDRAGKDYEIRFSMEHADECGAEAQTVWRLSRVRVSRGRNR
jgi:hypothetical protein